MLAPLNRVGLICGRSEDRSPSPEGGGRNPNGTAHGNIYILSTALHGNPVKDSSRRIHRRFCDRSTYFSSCHQGSDIRYPICFYSADRWNWNQAAAGVECLRIRCFSICTTAPPASHFSPTGKCRCAMDRSRSSSGVFRSFDAFLFRCGQMARG